VLLELLYRVPGDEWLDTGLLIQEMVEEDDAEDTLLRLLVGETLHRLTSVLEEFGAAELTRVGASSQGEYEVLSLLVDLPAAGSEPGSAAGDRVRLTPLGRSGVREILLEEEFAAPAPRGAHRFERRRHARRGPGLRSGQRRQ
jgi:hypothetical protein